MNKVNGFEERTRKSIQEAGFDPDLKPFLPMQHYIEKFHFQPWDEEASFSPGVDATWDYHYQLSSLYKFHWGFTLPTRELIDQLVDILQRETGSAGRVLDAGSGSGFLARELCRLGVDTFAVDTCDYENREHQFGYPMIQVHQRDVQGDAVEYVAKGFGAVLLVWPGYDHPFGHNIAKAMLPGQLLVYEGEIRGCCADDAFFDYLDDPSTWEHRADLSDALNACHVTFAGVHDRWRVYRKVFKNAT